MIQLATAVVLLLALGLGLYWLVRFLWILPIEQERALETRRRESLEALVSRMAAAAALASPSGGAKEAAQAVLRELSTLSPGLAFWLLEEDPPGHWAPAVHAGASSAEPTPALDAERAQTLPAGPTPLAALAEAEPRGGFLRAVAALGVGSVASRRLPAGPSVKSGGRGLLIAGSPDASGEALARAAWLLEPAGSFIAALWTGAGELKELRRREGELKESIQVTIQELTSTNIRLAQRSREMKTLYEVASTITSNPGSPQASLSALVSIIARALEADLCAFLLLDEERGELVTQPGAYGVAGDEVSLYRLPLTNSEASSVRVFLTGRPFITGSEQSDPRVLAHFAKLWKANSLIVVPLSIEERTIGVLRVGSFKENCFGDDHLRFVSLIAEEAAVIIESAMLVQRLAQTAQELANLNRMKDEFISTVSHELRTPLTSIQGFLAVVLSGEAGPLDDQQRHFLTIARGAATRLNALIGDLLDVSRLEGGAEMEHKPVDLVELVRRSVEMHMPQARAAGVELKAAIPEKLPRVAGDARWLLQVVDNLISNALKFTRPGGSVVAGLQDKGDMVLAWVSDTGIGIPAKEKERVFEKFYRVRTDADFSPPGTGLGLTIVKNVVEKLKGKVWVESELGRGSRFSLVLPAAKTPEAGPMEEEAEGQPA